jgi:hypothetical protein
MSPDTTPAAYAAILSAITAHSGAHPDDLDIREHLRVATWILDEMASTFLMLAFANACDTCDEAARHAPGLAPHPDKPRPGGNYADHPEPSDDTAEAARAAAARLYAAVLGAPDGYDPAPAIVRWVERDRVNVYWYAGRKGPTEPAARCWGHNAVMSAIGHGVSWDDDNAPLRDEHGGELPRPGYRMGVSAEDIDWCDEHTDAARDVLDGRAS